VADLPLFRALQPAELIAWDYRSSDHSTRGHPVEPLRASLAAQGMVDARSIGQMKGERTVKFAGLVICRQRPPTAGGVVFMTVEDETGFVNVVIWQRIFEQFRVLAKTASFIGISGKTQAESGVVHVVAETLWVPELVPGGRPGSRNFH
jgi:error-prone DNA polymerase